MLVLLIILPFVLAKSSLHFPRQNFVIAVHAGAGSYNRTKISLDDEKLIKEGVLEALKAGYHVLKNGGNHLQATEEAIIKLEDYPLFNAGKGGKINQDFEVELDASIMDGSNLDCGAVAAVKHIKNPIKAARKIMTDTKHILLASKGADKFAKDKGLEILPNYYFFTPKSIKEWFDAKEKKIPLKRTGTVGAVALDLSRNLAAATSTGGTSYKMPGRVGDSPIIGAGNYANNESCAVSCTGIGEIMIKRAMAFDIHARMIYKNLSLKDATQEVMDSLDNDVGGFISIDKNGNVEMPYNSAGMARGYVKSNGIAYIYIFKDGEDLSPTEYKIDN
jgi:beta-aspartyl-peptidase (threonine type)